MQIASSLALLGSLVTALAAKDFIYRTDNLERRFAKRDRPAAAAADRGLEEGRHLAAFTAPLDDALADSLAARGAVIAGLAHKADDFFLYLMDLQGKERDILPLLRAYPAFLEIQPERLEDKVETRLLRGEDLEYVDRSGSFRATVQLRRKLGPAALAALFRGVDSLQVDAIDSNLVHIVAHRAVAMKLAERKEVARLRGPVRRLPIMAASRTLTRVDALQAGYVTPVFPPTTSWLAGVRHTGDGIWIGIQEGIDFGHKDFSERAANGTDQLRLAVPGESWYASSHGTHVASIAAGNGWNSHLSPSYPGTTLQWRGVAPKARLSTQGGMDVNNHSFIHDYGYYSSGAQGEDADLSNHTVGSTDMEVNNVGVYGVANNGGGAQYGTERGYYSLLNQTKNGIKVGSTLKLSTPVKADHSSLGPTRDGRVGPDVMAPGAGYPGGFALELDQVSLVNGTTTKYTWTFDAGTSGWGAGPPYSQGINNLAAAGGSLNFSTAGLPFIFSGAMSPQPVSALGDQLVIRYRARTIDGMGSNQINLGMYWKRPQDGFVKGCCESWDTPVRVYGMRLVADNTWREARYTLNSTSLYRDGGGWVAGDVLEKLRLDFQGEGGVVAAWEGTQDYIGMGGTSMASPHVTGIAALMLQKYRDDVLKVRCNTCTIHNHPLWNSSVRAILIHTARDMVNEAGTDPGAPNPDFVAAGHSLPSIYGKGPDFATGYGLADAERAVAYVDRNRFREGALGQGNRNYYTFTVPAGTPRLRVTLAWDDPPMVGANDETTAYAVKLVNDLDLQVVDLNTGRRYKPWVLPHAGLNNGTIPADGIDNITPDMIRARAARPGRDSLNNVEVVDIEAPPAGTWAIMVEGRSVAVDQNAGLPGINQDYSLVHDFPILPAGGLYLPSGMHQQVLAGGGGTMIALKADGTVWSWGENAWGQAGRTAANPALSPGQVTGLPIVHSITSHLTSSLALARDGRIFAWGYNYGQLGDGTTAHRAAPVLVCDNTSQPCYGNRYGVVSVGSNVSAAIKEDGTLWAWGDDWQGALGGPAPRKVLYPAQVGTDRDWVWVSTGNGYFLALKADGSLWGWGQNELGQVGIGSASAVVYPPVRIGTATWRSVRAGTHHALGVQSDGSLWAWGSNGFYEAALQEDNVHAPRRVGAATDWKAVAPGLGFSLALKNDGTLYAWGGNQAGELGRFTTSLRESEPRPVCEAAGWPCSGGRYVAMAPSKSTVIALRADGTAWAWGSNSAGTFGNGSQTGSAYPVKVTYTPHGIAVATGSTAAAVTRNLTAEGVQDWYHWGTASASTLDQKAGVTPLLGNYALTGAFTAGRDVTGWTTSTWSDGIAPRYSQSTVSAVSTTVAGTGFQLQLPSAPTPRTVRVYVAVNNATGRLSASLSDNSVPAYTHTGLTSTGRRDGYYELTYSSPNSANLVINWTKASGTGTVSLQSAVVK